MTGKYALTFDLISPLLALKDDDDDRRPHLPPIVKPSDCGNATSADGSVDATTDVPKWIGCRTISLAPRCCLRLSYGLGAGVMTVTPVFVCVGTPPLSTTTW